MSAEIGITTEKYCGSHDRWVRTNAYIYIYLESGTPPGPQIYVVLRFLFDCVCFFHLLIIYERSKFLVDVLFLVCESLDLFWIACFFVALFLLIGGVSV
jgi:hypothetical protein